MHVASTVGRGIISPQAISDEVIFGALMGAISWNLMAGYLGIPTSSSHALIGGLIGAGVAHVGFGAIVWNGCRQDRRRHRAVARDGTAHRPAPHLAVSWAFVKSAPSQVDGIFRKVQFVSASLYSLGHGGNDAQKTMGIIAALLAAHGQLPGAFHIPLWVVIMCNGAMALGTLFGGWKIVRTKGSRITHLTPLQGVVCGNGGLDNVVLWRQASAYRSRRRKP